jgi:leucyl/phenylalanyl-tRNA--protein transferase
VSIPSISTGSGQIPPSPWSLVDPRLAGPDSDLVCIGAELDPVTVLRAYTLGLFPMHVEVETGEQELGWWSPDPRGILRLDQIRVSRSLRRSMRKFTVTFDQAFERVMRSCWRAGGDGNWITDEFVETYTHLYESGFAHSVEVWNADGELVGGLYGIEIGGLFAGESMFHRERDASKVALVSIVRKLGECSGKRLFDVQWQTDHLTTLGVTQISRKKYLDELARVLLTKPCLSLFGNDRQCNG